ncbi:MAG: riboflavin kinase, partial [Alphaproteobacteria bacterium]|nr:riboflavin kinase [Alphaproteobacteria bacterium]
PTANMKLGDMAKPAFGVYTIAARLADDPAAPIYGGVANLGIRPTANDRGVLLEANLFEYDGDLYGQRLNIFMLDFIRPEMTFESFDKLKDQIARDAETARIYHRDNLGQ